MAQTELSFDVRRHGSVDVPRSRSPWWRDVLLRRMLAVADLTAGLLVATYLALGSLGPSAYWVAVVSPAWVVLAKLHGLYDRDQRALRLLTVDELPRICFWGVTGTAGTAIVLSTLDPGALELSTLFSVWIVASGTAVVLRTAARATWRALTPPERTLIVGRGALAAAATRKLLLFPDIHLQLAGEPAPLADPAAVHRALRERGIERVILASESIDEGLIAELLSICRRDKVKLTIVPPVRAMFGTAVQLDNVADLPFLQYNTWDVSRSTLLLKRALDVSLSIVGLVLFAPVAAVIALAIRLDTPGPIIFSQRRAGRGGRPFRMFKFRTMIENAEAALPELVPFDELDEPMFKLRDDPRITRVGHFLRRASLDELPQLVNVLQGNMSLVGPRPEQVELVERYGPEERVRLAVKPGMTGPMQVMGRGELTLDERVAVEREYIENLALGRDLRILAMTMPAVLGARGAF